jgi:hypothetical protein
LGRRSRGTSGRRLRRNGSDLARARAGRSPLSAGRARSSGRARLASRGRIGRKSALARSRKRLAAGRWMDVSADDQRYNFDQINAYRRSVGVAPLVLDPTISAFALDGSKQLSVDHIYHAHNARTYWETQGYKFGTPIPGWPDSPDVRSAIDTILSSMWKEAPSPPGTSPNDYNHHDIMASPLFTKVGVGLVIDVTGDAVGGAPGTLYLTNDFSK